MLRSRGIQVRSVKTTKYRWICVESTLSSSVSGLLPFAHLSTSVPFPYPIQGNAGQAASLTALVLPSVGGNDHGPAVVRDARRAGHGAGRLLVVLSGGEHRGRVRQRHGGGGEGELGGSASAPARRAVLARDGTHQGHEKQTHRGGAAQQRGIDMGWMGIGVGRRGVSCCSATREGKARQGGGGDRGREWVVRPIYSFGWQLRTGGTSAPRGGLICLPFASRPVHLARQAPSLPAAVLLGPGPRPFAPSSHLPVLPVHHETPPFKPPSTAAHPTAPTSPRRAATGPRGLETPPRGRTVVAKPRAARRPMASGAAPLEVRCAGRDWPPRVPGLRHGAPHPAEGSEAPIAGLPHPVGAGGRRPLFPRVPATAVVPNLAARPAAGSDALQVRPSSCPGVYQ